MHKKLFIAFAAAFVFAAGTAIAADEVKPCNKTHIAAFDSNKDGVLATDERQAGRKARFAEMDADKNGKLGKEEFVKGHEQWGGKMDKNADALVEVAEYTLFFCGEEPQQADKSKHADAKQSYVKCYEYRTALFAEMDANKDGKISADERAKYNEGAFAKMDRNADGFIQVEEFYEVEIVMPCKGKCGKDCKCGKGGKEGKPCKKEKRAGAMCPNAQKAAAAAAAVSTGTVPSGK